MVNSPGKLSRNQERIGFCPKLIVSSLAQAFCHWKCHPKPFITFEMFYTPTHGIYRPLRKYNLIGRSKYCTKSSRGDATAAGVRYDRKCLWFSRKYFSHTSNLWCQRLYPAHLCSRFLFLSSLSRLVSCSGDDKSNHRARQPSNNTAINSSRLLAAWDTLVVSEWPAVRRFRIWVWSLGCGKCMEENIDLWNACDWARGRNKVYQRPFFCALSTQGRG